MSEHLLSDYLLGSTVVVKLGGNAMTKEGISATFCNELIELKQRGVSVVLVHGGGPQISSLLEQHNIETSFLEGLRVTTPEAFDVVRMALVGQVQRNIVNALNSTGSHAVGLSGEDARLFTAKKRNLYIDGKTIDIGLVGEIVHVDISIVMTLLESSYIPVISSISPNAVGSMWSEVYNVNADNATGALAAALGADAMIMLTNVNGLYHPTDDDNRVIEHLTADELLALMPTLKGGMLPKMEACLLAVKDGVNASYVVNGNEENVIAKILAGRKIGTKVIPG